MRKRTERLSIEIPEFLRFWSKVNIIDECWIWKGAKNTGYGTFRTKDSGIPTYAHRFSFEHFVGTIPPGLVVDHVCKHKSCVNPFHMELVTPRENTLRGRAPSAANAIKNVCLRGHPLSGPNVYFVNTPSGGIARHCRECNRTASRNSWRKKHGK